MIKTARAFLLFVGLILLGTSSFAQKLDITTYPKPLLPEPTAWLNESGNITSLDDYKGQVVLLNVWATWCPPCIREMPQLDKLQWRYGNAGFTVLPISQDKAEQPDGADVAIRIRDFYNRYRIQHLPVHHDPGKNVTQAFPARTLPTSYLMNKKGEIVATAGFGDWLSDDARAIIEHELRQNSGNPTQATSPTADSVKTFVKKEEQDPRDSFWDDIFKELGLNKESPKDK